MWVPDGISLDLDDPMLVEVSDSTLVGFDDERRNRLWCKMNRRTFCIFVEA